MADADGNTPIRLTLKRHTEVVELDVGTDGQEVYKTFVLQEMSGAQRDAYVDTQQRRVKFEDGKPVGVTSMKDVQAELISRCLVDKDGFYGDPGKLVPIRHIQDYPSTVQDTLYERCVKINRLDAESKEAAKKA